VLVLNALIWSEHDIDSAKKNKTKEFKDPTHIPIVWIKRKINKINLIHLFY